MNEGLPPVRVVDDVPYCTLASSVRDSPVEADPVALFSLVLREGNARRADEATVRWAELIDDVGRVSPVGIDQAAIDFERRSFVTASPSRTDRVAPRLVSVGKREHSPRVNPLRGLAIVPDGACGSGWAQEKTPGSRISRLRGFKWREANGLRNSRRDISNTDHPERSGQSRSGSE